MSCLPRTSASTESSFAREKRKAYQLASSKTLLVLNVASDITQTHSRKHRRRGVPIAEFTVGTETPLPHPPSAQKEKAVDGAHIFVTYEYYYYEYYNDYSTVAAQQPDRARPKPEVACCFARWLPHFRSTAPTLPLSPPTALRPAAPHLKSTEPPKSSHPVDALPTPSLARMRRDQFSHPGRGSF